MKQFAELRIVTVDTARVETLVKGWMQTGENPSFGYDDTDYSLTVTVADGIATVTRKGICGYTLTLDKGRVTQADFGEFTADLRTDMLLCKASDSRLEFAARYSIGNTRDTDEIIIKAIPI